MQLFSWTAYTHKSHTWHSEPKHGSALPQLPTRHPSRWLPACVHSCQLQMYSPSSVWHIISILTPKVFQDYEAASDWMPWGLCPEQIFLQDPLVTSDHEKSDIHLQPMPLMPQGIDGTARNPGTSPWTETFSGFAWGYTVNNIYGDFWQIFL